MITLTVDEFHSNSNSDNSLSRYSNGNNSPAQSANHNSDTHPATKINLKNYRESTLSTSYSEVFMNNDSYVAPGADILLDPSNYNPESGKRGTLRSSYSHVS